MTKTPPLPGRATKEGTASFASRSGLPPACFREMAGSLTVSSVGLGTYLGDIDDETDRMSEQACRAVLAGGINVLDTAIVYRHMLSERALGRALRAAVAEGAVAREEVVVATKGGYIAVDALWADDPQAYLERTYLDAGIFTPEDVAGGSHCLSPGFLEHQLATSLENMGLQSVDVYFLHNPESQLGEVSRPRFLERMAGAFEWLEEKAARGTIGIWGLATWNGLRAPPEHRDHLPLETLVGLAREKGGEGHRFRVIQLPFNLGMVEAANRPTQELAGNRVTCLEAAGELGLSVWGSASIMQGQVMRRVPPQVARAFKERTTDLEAALEFARSAPGIHVALIGLKKPDHVEEALRLYAKPPLGSEAVRRLVEPKEA